MLTTSIKCLETNSHIGHCTNWTMQANLLGSTGLQMTTMLSVHNCVPFLLGAKLLPTFECSFFRFECVLKYCVLTWCCPIYLSPRAVLSCPQWSTSVVTGPPVVATPTLPSERGQRKCRQERYATCDREMRGGEGGLWITTSVNNWMMLEGFFP